jgi:hypothetical protein
MTVVRPSDRAVAWHEASHAAALCLAGMVPKQVRTDWPDATTLGRVAIDWGDGPDHGSAREVLRAILVGGMCDGLEGWDSWPVNPQHVPEGARRDAEQARHLAEYLKLDRVGWAFHVWRAEQLAKQPRYRRLVVARASALEEREVLDASDLKRIHEREEQACNA